MRTIRFGVIGCGLMGREFASATARWCHLSGLVARPEIVIACDKDASRLEWFKRNGPMVTMPSASNPLPASHTLPLRIAVSPEE